MRVELNFNLIPGCLLMYEFWIIWAEPGYEHLQLQDKCYLKGPTTCINIFLQTYHHPAAKDGTRTHISFGHLRGRH